MISPTAPKIKSRLHTVWWPMLLGWGVGITLLFIVLMRVNPEALWRQLRGLAPQHLLGPLAISIIGIPLRPWRWALMFPQDRRPGFRRAFVAYYISMMANNVLPARGGDLLRCFLLEKDQSLAHASCVMGTLAVEKVMDGLMLLGVVLISLHFLPPIVWLSRLTIISAIFLGSALILLLVLPHGSSFIFTIFQKIRARRLGGFRDRLDRLIANLSEGLAAIRSPRRCAVLFGLTAAAWFLEATFVATLAYAMNVHISLIGSALVIAILGLGLMIPAAPGFVGTYEFFSVAAFGLFSIPNEAALALTFVLHAWVFFLMMILGIGALVVGGMPFSILTKRSMPARQESVPEKDI